MDAIAPIASGMHSLVQAIMVPVIAAIAILAFIAIFSAGSAIVEFFTERRHLKADLPSLMDAVEGARVDELVGVIEGSGLLVHQRIALSELLGHASLPIDSLVALARRLIEAEQERYVRRVALTDTVSKLGPMLGLMGTLIPLGPGIVGLAEGDIVTLSNALLVAFDTTVCGLGAAAVAAVVSKVRGIWYEGYMSQLEAVMTGVLKRVEEGIGASSSFQGTCGTEGGSSR